MTVPSDSQVDATIRAATPAVKDVARRLKKAKRDLAALDKLGISLPVGIENNEQTRSRRAEKITRNARDFSNCGMRVADPVGYVQS